MLDLSDIEHQPLYDRLKEAIRQQVRQGRWSPGDRVPTVRQLSRDLGIAYTTVARSIRELVQEGVLDSNLGGGTRVAIRRVQQRMGAIGILGYAPATEIERSSACNSHLLRLLQEQVVTQGRMVVYDHLRPDVPIGTMFRDMALVDGLFLIGKKHEPLESLINLTRGGVPVICVADSQELQLASINSANIEDTLRATRLLLKRGHRRIAIIDNPTSASDLFRPSRMMGYRQAMAQSREGFHPEWCVCDLLVEDQASHLRSLDPAPTALICTNAGHFRQLYRLLKGSPVEPGKQLEVCVYDDDVWHTVESVGIDYLRIEQPWITMADAAVGLMLQFVDGRPYEACHHEYPGRVVQVCADGTTSMVHDD